MKHITQWASDQHGLACASLKDILLVCEIKTSNFSMRSDQKAFKYCTYCKDGSTITPTFNKSCRFCKKKKKKKKMEVLKGQNLKWVKPYFGAVKILLSKHWTIIIINHNLLCAASLAYHGKTMM